MQSELASGESRAGGQLDFWSNRGSLGIEGSERIGEKWKNCCTLEIEAFELTDQEEKGKLEGNS